MALPSSLYSVSMYLYFFPRASKVWSSGPTYHLMGFETDFFTPIFVISRITGWSAHIMEQHAANKLIRPLAKYKGSKHRKVMELNSMLK